MSAVSLDKNITELYQDIILNHSKAPKNIGILNNPDCCSNGVNPLCGDKVTISVSLDKNKFIHKILFDAKGCAISIASASMMTEAVKGLFKDDIFLLADGVDRFCNENDNLDKILNSVDEKIRNPLSSLQALSGVRNFPARLRCVSLPWETLISCVQNKDFL
jgi:nitrogen fixation NifU-like protein